MNARVQENVRTLRREGKSIRDISKSLGISKSTVSYWCRDIRLTSAQIKKLAEDQRTTSAGALMRASEKKRLQRIRATAEEKERGSKDIGKISRRDLFMIGLALYWGEGYKKGNDELGFTNSDPGIVRGFIRWLAEIYAIRKTDLILRLSINQQHRHRISSVRKYWATVTGVPESQFSKASLIKTASKKRYVNEEQHFGTLRIKVRRATNLRRRILGSIEEIARQIS